MSDVKHQLVKLMATATCSSLVLGFTVYYTAREASYFTYICDNNGVDIPFPQIVLLYCYYGRWAFVIPLISLICGLYVLYKRPQSLAVFELLIFGAWLPTIIIAGFCFVGWQFEHHDLEYRELLLTQHGK